MLAFRMTLAPVVMLALLAACLSSWSRAACAQTRKEIPADWFYEGANRPKPLKDLEGKPAAAIAGATWIGDAVTIEASLGKVVVLDFWATWCGPCMAAIPENVKLYTEYKDRGLVFIGVHDGAKGWDRADAVVKEKSINYPVVKDQGDTVKAYNLQFWPTYVAIDRSGIVRAAGLLPNRVRDVVDILLAEPPPAGLGAGSSAGANPPSWYYAGAARPSWLKAIEGRKLPPIQSQHWLGDALKPDDTTGKVIVIQFLAPESAIATSHLAELGKLHPELGPQGVTFLGVCDSRSAWDAATATLTPLAPRFPIMHDAPLSEPDSKPDAEAKPEPAADASPPPPAPAVAAPPSPDQKTPPIKSGKLAAALGVRLTPTIIVVDRSGTVRAAGVKVEKVKDIINKLLAEPVPEAPLPKQP